MRAIMAILTIATGASLLGQTLADDTSDNLRRAEQCLLSIPQKETRSIHPWLVLRDCAQTKPPTTEETLLTVLRARNNVSQRARIMAGRVTAGFPTNEVKALVRQVLSEVPEDRDMLNAVSHSVAYWGDGSFIPQILRRWSETRDDVLRQHLVDALLVFGLPASSALRDVFERDPAFERRHDILYKLVILNVPWAVVEFQKPEYGANGWDLRRQSFWERDVRLRRMRLAKEGKPMSKEQTHEVPAMPNGWRAPYDK